MKLQILACVLLFGFAAVAGSAEEECWSGEDVFVSKATLICDWYMEGMLNIAESCSRVGFSYERDRFAQALAEQLSMALKKVGELESARMFSESGIDLFLSMVEQEIRWEKFGCSTRQ
jgi:hypothetical protein